MSFKRDTSHHDHILNTLVWKSSGIYEDKSRNSKVENKCPSEDIMWLKVALVDIFIMITNTHTHTHTHTHSE